MTFGKMINPKWSNNIDTTAMILSTLLLKGFFICNPISPTVNL